MFPISEPFSYKVTSVGSTASLCPGPARLNSSSRRISPIQYGPLRYWYNAAVQWFLCLFLYLVTQHQRILPGFTSIHLWRERVVCITPQCSTITPIQLMCVLSGPFGLRDGLGSTCVLLQERTCLRTFAHIKHKWRRHMDKMGFSSVQLEGPSASCLPWLPTALHSATSKDGL